MHGARIWKPHRILALLQEMSNSSAAVQGNHLSAAGTSLHHHSTRAVRCAVVTRHISSQTNRSSLAGVKTSLLIMAIVCATSGPELVLNATEKTSASMTSKTWCLQAIHTRSVLRAHSINVHTPMFSPVLDDAHLELICQTIRYEMLF